METRFEYPPKPVGRDTSKLRVSAEFPKQGKVNHLSKGAPRVVKGEGVGPKQALMPGQTTVTGESYITNRFLDFGFDNR